MPESNHTPAPIGADTLSREAIRAIFLQHGFTIKEGQADLKPYVYEAAEALVRAALASAAQSTGEPVAYLWQHSETGRTRVVMPDAVITADATWRVVGPLVLAAAPKAAPALHYDAATGTFAGETLPEAAEHWAQWCEQRCLGGLPEFLRTVGRAVAAQAQAHHPDDAEIMEVVGPLGYAQLDPVEVARAVLARWATAPQPPAVVQEPVAYRHMHEDGWEYYDAPTGGACPGCIPLYTHPAPAAQGDAPGRWLVVNIGCIECGVSTALVGRFDSKELAQAVANECAREHGWRDGGQNDFEVFDLDAPCSSEYAEAIARAAKEGDKPCPDA